MRPQPKPFTSEDREKVISLMKQGFSQSQIARELNRASSSMHSIFHKLKKEHGLENVKINNTYTNRVSKSESINIKDIKSTKEKKDLLTIEERKEIEKYVQLKLPFSSIALILGRSVNGIRSEVEKNGGILEYNAEKSQSNYQERLKSSVTRLNEYNGSLSNQNLKKDFDSLKTEVDSLKMQIEILTEMVKNLSN